MNGLPVNIEELINGETVEWERIEFKKGWNPEDVLHSMCAFANDINNWGSGYIIIGIEEKNGKPIFPPKGLNQNQLDSYQGKIIELCHRMQPHYRPIIEPVKLQTKHILILWCPSGDLRPYKAPKSIRTGNTQILPYIRSGSNTIIAKGENLRQLEELTARIPFDDRINQQASLNDLHLNLIQSYLQQVKSNLFEESTKLSFEQLCKQMHIVKGGDEALRPVNVGLMFFNTHPENFFTKAQIELVIHHDETGRNFNEKYFKGPLQQQLKNALDYIQSNIISEKVQKPDKKAESDRFYNYPFQAVEEVLSNAVYHKGYDYNNPVEVQVFPGDSIQILSYPGPMPPIDDQMLQQRRIIARNYRNRRIGEFLKELHLTEGRGTGIPMVRNVMSTNGSPAPEFHTDEGRTYFQAILYIHPAFKEEGKVGTRSGSGWDQVKEWEINSLEDVDQLLGYLLEQKSNQVGNGVGDKVGDRDSDNVSDQVGEQVRSLVKKYFGTKLGLSWDQVVQILKKSTKPTNINDLMKLFNWSNRTKFRNKYMIPLLELDYINMTIPNKPKSSKQAYITTDKGKLLLKILKENNE